MTHHDIETYLRSHKPQVQEDPAFLLEAQRRMRAVDGIKAEVDRQHRRGRTALICALLLGMIAGAGATAILWFFPSASEAAGSRFLDGLSAFIGRWRYFLMLPTAGCAIALGILLGGRRKDLLHF